MHYKPLSYNFGEYVHALDHGRVALLDVMGCDEDIANAARISYDGKGKSADRGLIRYLLHHKHTTPFQMAEMKFEVKMPIFVARQFMRHRTASINEVSARYTELPGEFFIPEELMIQAKDNKQGRSEERLPADDMYIAEMSADAQKAHNKYKALLDEGVSREIARTMLPISIYTKFIWKMDLHNLMHFLHLRLDPHAQEEIREYAEIIENFVKMYFPITHEAFVDYVRDSYTCSKMEVNLVKQLLKDVPKIDNMGTQLGMTEREIKEFRERFLQ